MALSVIENNVMNAQLRFMTDMLRFKRIKQKQWKELLLNSRDDEVPQGLLSSKSRESDNK